MSCSKQCRPKQCRPNKQPHREVWRNRHGTGDASQRLYFCRYGKRTSRARVDSSGSSPSAERSQLRQAASCVMTAGSGFAFYAQGVYLNALVEEQGFSTSAASAGTAIFFVAQGIGGYFTGALISRFDARVVITFGAIVSAAGIALLGEVRNEWQMAGVFVLFGAGYALAGLVPATSIVTR